MISRFWLWSAMAWCLIACVPVLPVGPVGLVRVEDPVLPVKGMFEYLRLVIAPPPGAHAVATGTAFFIPSVDREPQLLTAAHVVDGCLRIDVLSDSLPAVHAELVISDSRTDLAIVRLPALAFGQEARRVTTLAFLPLNAPPPDAGGVLTLIGYPLGGTLSRATMFKVTNITTTVPNPRDPAAILLVQGEGAHGDSGAPILNDRGQVVGVFQGVIEDMAKATHLMGAPIEHVGFARAPLAISNFWRRHPIGAIPISAGTPDATPESLRSAVVRVICWRERLIH